MIDPLDAVKFGPVVRTLHEDRSGGWRQARDVMLTNFETFTAQYGSPYQIVKLAIELDRHALFCDVAAAKDNREQDQEALKKFQDYLHGDVTLESVAPPTTKTLSAHGVTVTVDDPDGDDDDHDEGDE